MLKAGGDTDTNACIVGGMLGAMIGFEKLPEKPKAAVLNRKNNNGIKRDQFRVSTTIRFATLPIKLCPVRLM